MISTAKLRVKVGAAFALLVVIATTVAIPDSSQAIQPQPIPPKSRPKGGGT